jgi:hypothetical protein
VTAHATHSPTDWAVFIAVTLIWSTTPLAIVVSNQNIDPFLSFAARMLLSLLILSAWYLVSTEKQSIYLINNDNRLNNPPFFDRKC